MTIRPGLGLAVMMLVGSACSGAITPGSSGDAPGGDPAPATGGAGAMKPGGGGPTNGGTPMTMIPPATPGAAACGGALDVAFAPMRRLTREQYGNVVRDLLGLARVTTTGLTADESIGAFHSNAVGAATDLVAQQYMEASESLAQQAAATLEMRYPCDRAARGDEDCGAAFIEVFGQRAYRRPLQDPEKARYRTLFAAHAGAGYREGLRAVAQTMLQSPYFLYHLEFLEGAAGATGVVPLGRYALASRLSFFLWNTIPDDTLLMAAGAGQLDTPTGLKAQAERLLKDARVRRTLESFHGQWLDIERITSMTKDTRVFPSYTTMLRDAMWNETVAFVDHVVRRGDGKLDTLLTAPFSVIDGPLFDLYGVTRPAGFAPGQTVMLDGTRRAGVLTHASVLAVHAHANQTSPVARGALVRKNLLCQDLPDPPPDVNSTPPEPKPGLTTRERFVVHKMNPSCAGCHKLIDDLGFGFERYDGIGAYRETENGKPVDGRGEMFGTRDIDGAFDGAMELARRLAGSQEVRACVARQWMRFAMGRFEDSMADACTIKQVMDTFVASGGDVRALLTAIVTSDGFRHRRAVAAN